MKKKLITLMLALVLCLAMCPAVHAASGDLTMTAYLPGNMMVPFTSGVVNVYDLDENVVSTAYYKYAKLPDNTTFSSVMTIFTFTGTALKVNGVTVATSSPKTVTIDFTTAATVEVVYNGGSKMYYVSAFPSEYEVKMSFEYENARAFSTLSGDTYGTSGLLDSVTSAQKTAAAQAVAEMDAMCESMLPDLTAAQYKVMDPVTIEWNSTVPNSNNLIGLMEQFASARDDFEYDTGSGFNTIVSIGSLDKDSTGTVSGNGSGGWMYQVKRGNNTYIPMIGADGWILIPGDEVTWRYTCDYGYDIGVPMAP